jgi:hypothetical protein
MISEQSVLSYRGDLLGACETFVRQRKDHLG